MNNLLLCPDFCSPFGFIQFIYWLVITYQPELKVRGSVSKGRLSNNQLYLCLLLIWTFRPMYVWLASKKKNRSLLTFLYKFKQRMLLQEDNYRTQLFYGPKTKDFNLLAGINLNQYICKIILIFKPIRKWNNFRFTNNSCIIR